MIITIYTPNNEASSETREYFLDRDHLTPVHWIDEELDPETETAYLFQLTGFGNTALGALYSGFSESEAFEKLQADNPEVDPEQIVSIAEAHIIHN